MTTALLSVRRLRVYYHLNGAWPWSKGNAVKAVDGVDFDLQAGQTLGIAGESGCGKSTLARALMGLQRVTSGNIQLADKELTQLTRAGWQKLRCQVQMVFQDPIASLNPRMTVGESIAEPLVNLAPELSRAQRQRQAVEMLEKVGLSNHHVLRYPHELSGGQCQRIGIARALVVKPSILICDEPVSALDVSVQAQIINLLKDLQADMRLAIIFIAHNLSIVRQISHRVLIMYLGKIMEQATREALFERPGHPYTRALLSAIPIPEIDSGHAHKRVILRGDPPSPASPPSGCVFRSRCPWAAELCAQEVPTPRHLELNQIAACHFAGELDEMSVGSTQELA
jgi:oligopeptide transport system ATP-binding protein